MRMALVGSSAFPTDDQEDKDFFEQLANDLGDDGHVSELEKPVGSFREYELEEVNCNESFSKLTISGAGSDLVSSTITEENGKIDSAGDDFWLEDVLSEASAAASQEGTRDNRPRSRETLGNTGHTDISKTMSGGLDYPCENANAGICAQENINSADNRDAEHRFTPCDVDNSTSLVFSPEAGSGNPQGLNSNFPVGEGVCVSDVHVFDSANDARQSVALDAFISTAIRSEALSLDPQNLVSADRVKMTEEDGSTNVKELQWSSFGQVFSPEEEQGAFGSFSDFLTDLPAGTGLINDSGTQSRNQEEEDWSLSAPLAASTSETGTEANFGFGSDMDVSECFNEPGVNYHDIRSKGDGQAILRHTKMAEISEQVLGHSGAGWQGIESETRGQAHGDFAVSSNTAFQVQSQESPQQSWENMYPGWFYDYATNEWKQIEGYDFGTGTETVVEEASSLRDGSSDVPLGVNEAIASQMGAFTQGDGFSGNATDLSYQSTALEHVAVSSEEELRSMKETQVYAPSTDVYSVQGAHYDAVPQPQVYYEEQYPGWYYDYHTQEWRQIADNSHAWQLNAPSQDNKTTESQVVDSYSMNHDDGSSLTPVEEGQPEYQHQQNQNTYWPENSQSLYTSGVGVNTLSQSVSFNSRGGSNLAFNANEQSNITTDNKGEVFQGTTAVLDSWSGWQGYNNDVFHSPEQPQTKYVQADNSAFFGAQSSHHFPHVQQYPQAQVDPRKLTEASQSSAGRPPHPLAAFGFGGKFAVMKATSGVQVGMPGPIILHELKQLVESAESSGQGNGPSYFLSLSQGLTGPLVGGGFTNKELFRWIDERADNCELEDPYCSSTQGLHLLWNVLKIACVHYGKLRSMVGSAGIKSQAEDGPEVALGRLFASTKSSSWSHGFSTSPDTLQSMPTEQQLQATAVEVKKSLVAGKRKEALQLAQQGQLWGPALVLAWQLGEKFYGDTVSQMAQQQFVPGSPLRTLFLLFAGQPTELFTTQNMPSSGSAQGPYSVGSYSSAKQDSAGGMLGDWLENLSIIAANRTKGDEQIIMHLGDCLWKERGEVAGAHTCYLVAEANLESFSKNARVCLVGADHFKHQRTFATPQAIQRTELYEYAKVLGNSQYILVPFQPYKLLYAHMLAEAGKVAEARRYCQAVTKTLKNAGRAPEIESCRQSAVALEERLRLHSQGGYSLNSATGKLVGKFIGTIDSTIHRIIGGPPPSQVSESLQHSYGLGNGKDWHASDQRTGNTAPQSSFTSLVPSASINSFFNASNPVEVPTRSRSISEPDFSRSPIQEPSNPATSADVTASAPNHRKTEASGGGYLGRFGTQFFAKAVGFIKPNKKEAKLGDKNKFYYDEKLKRWVEEGVEQNSEDIALPPPPTMASFDSGFGTPALATKTGAGTEGQGQVSTTFRSGSISSDTPPMPPSVNQFSARTRLHGVRSRYVDTFNKGGNTPSPAMSSQSPIVPSTGQSSTSSPVQLFVPASILTPANEFSGMPSDNGQVNFDKSERPSGPTLNSILNGHSQAEHEPLEPKNLSSSFMAVPAISRHSSANNVPAYSREAIAAASGLGGGLSDAAAGNMLRAVSWNGDPSNLAQPDVSKFIPTFSGTAAMQGYGMPNGANLKINHTLSAVKAETSSIYSAGGGILPSPPLIEHPPSYMGIDNNLLPGAMENRSVPGAPNSGQGGIYGDMQEVEL